MDDQLQTQDIAVNLTMSEGGIGVFSFLFGAAQPVYGAVNPQAKVGWKVFADGALAGL